MKNHLSYMFLIIEMVGFCQEEQLIWFWFLHLTAEVYSNSFLNGI
jgi:hypothetical protein